MTEASPSGQGWSTTARSVLVEALHPPVGDLSFWAVQVTVVLLAGLHLYLDSVRTLEPSAFPTGSPVALLLAPVLYATLRYGLAGAAATALWATVLWLPDIALPNASGHPADDVIDLLIVDAVAVFVGTHIERGRIQRRRADTAEKDRREVENQYRELLQTNVFPILIVDGHGVISEVNPAGVAAFGDRLVGSQIDKAMGVAHQGLGVHDEESIEAIETADGVAHTFRLRVAHVWAPGDEGGDRWQLVFQDVTVEYRERAEARSYAALLMTAQEEERRHIAHELHDDPLQRLIHLARRLESLGAEPGPAPATAALVEARLELLDVIGRVRDIARGLRPPGLDQLGLVAAVRGLLADVEDAHDLRVEFDVSGAQVRLDSAVELGAFRIIQEAVRNVTRHASAQTLTVHLEYVAGGLAIRVVDDGVGFDAARQTPITVVQLGVVGMRERASLLGGRLVVSSAGGRGAVIDAQLPSLPPRHPAAS